MIKDIPKKVAAVHDIAGFGRSSLTVVMPTLSVMGHQACPAPTAVLSSITGFYKGYAMMDLTDFLTDCFVHWQKESCAFDCIYTGFIGSARGVEVTAEFIRRAKAPLVVVDPVFADDGRCYECFTPEMADKMLFLIRNADIITPNLTEACFLSGEAYEESLACAMRCAEKLSGKTNGAVVITGVPDEDRVGVLIKDGNAFYKIENMHLNSRYPGTGDLFTSVLCGAVLSGMSLCDSAAKAADFVFQAIAAAEREGVPQREGVPMELLVSRLLEDHRLPVERIL